MKNIPANFQFKNLKGLIIGSLQSVRGTVSHSKFTTSFLSKIATVSPKIVENLMFFNNFKIYFLAPIFFFLLSFKNLTFFKMFETESGVDTARKSTH